MAMIGTTPIQRLSPSRRQLRPYQQEAYDKVLKVWDSGCIRTVVVHATGLGKSDIIAKLATDEALQGGRVLILAHRRKLLNQIRERCALYSTDVQVGIIQAETNELTAPIIAASVQTLCKDKRMALLVQAWKQQPTMLIIDEVHHAKADSYEWIMHFVGSYDVQRPCRTVGFTATLTRGDGQTFGGMFPVVADTKDIQWALTQNPPLLAKPIGRVITLRNMVLDLVPLYRGDFSAKGLSPYVEQNTRQIVQAWQREAGHRITAAFAPTVTSACALHAEFRAAGVKSELVIGTTPEDEREVIYNRLEAGITRVLVNVMVATEGFDCPAISCVLLARPTRHIGLYTQVIGRGLRLYTDPITGETKKDCLVLDVVGVSRLHKLVTLVDLYRPSGSISHVEKRSPRWWQRTRYENVELLPQRSLAGRFKSWLLRS